VAGRLRPLRPALHPHGLAQRRHLPHRRRPRRRRRRQQRFAPLNSWPDNVNLDKARRLLWPIKQKYGRKISWADLMILTGNVALESMGFKTFGFGGGRADVWEPEEDVYWGPRHLAGRQALQRRPRAREPAGRRADGPDLRQPGRPERQSRSARRGARHPRDLRAHGDERRGDRGADRRRPHLRQDPRRRPGHPRRPRAGSRALEEQGLGWKSSFGTGVGGDAITSGLEVTWTSTPTKWSNNFFWNLFGYEWELTKSPAGAHQWTPKNGAGAIRCPTRTTRRSATRRRC
jgi:catalase-peroxidase